MLHTTQEKTTVKKHIPGPWRIEADSEKQGLHPLHDNRWIVAGSDPDGPDWADNSYTRICKLMDIEKQPGTAELIASAPKMAATLAKIEFDAAYWSASLKTIADRSSEDSYLDTGECLELLGAISGWLDGILPITCAGADNE